MCWSRPPEGIVSLGDLINATWPIAFRRTRIVLTSGVFDLITPGHVGMLQEAAQQGTHLIVAINSDYSVNKLKGEQRPINDQDVRAKTLIGIKGVYTVVIFGDTTADAVIRTAKPHLFARGGDKADPLFPELPLLHELGIPVYKCEKYGTVSTSSLIAQIRGEKID